MTLGLTLRSLIQHSSPKVQLERNQLRPGDWLLVDTLNSKYVIYSAGDGRYLVSGGWFDREQISPCPTTINGCTWGGSVIKPNTLAACGLRLEFGNRVVTTPIRAFRVLRTQGQQTPN
jgi:hypothetical protein